MNNALQMVYDRLTDNKIVVQCNYLLASLSKIKCGGVVDMLVEPCSVSQLVDTMRIIVGSGVPYYIIGGASKVLIMDGHIYGIVVYTGRVAGIDIAGNTAQVMCGTHTVLCANALAQAGLSGAEYMYCLPATVGGAVYMNAGCYGMVTSDIVDSVSCLDLVSGDIVNIDNSHCCFSRRTSIFSTLPLLILTVNLLLTNNDKKCIIDSMKELVHSKCISQPLTQPSLGSSFYTLRGDSASALIDRVGLKGFTIGGARISHKHAGFIINTGGASSADVSNVLDYISHVVQCTYDVTLHQEIIYMQMRITDDIRRLSYTHDQ